MCLNGKYVVQDQESRRFHHHKITAASRYAWSTDSQQDLISCCGWLSLIEPALFRSIYLGNSLWTFKFRGFVVVWRSWWPWCFHWITSDSEEFSPLCVSWLDRNVQWKFHCANWLLPIDFFHNNQWVIQCTLKAVIETKCSCISQITAEHFMYFI